MGPTPRFTTLGPRFDDGLDGPAWDGDGLLFCVPKRNEIHRWDEATGAVTRFRHSTVRTRGLTFAPDGRLYAAQSRARRVMWLSQDGGSYFLDATVDGERHNDPQDVVADRAGRLWFTDRYTDDSIPGPVGYPPLGHASVLRLEERHRTNAANTDTARLGQWTVQRMTFDTTAPCGLGFSPDGSTLYVTDGLGTAAQPSVLKGYHVTRFGVLGPPKTLHTWAAGEWARGLCIDRAGLVMVTVDRGGSGGAVELLEADGSGRETWATVERPTNCCLGGSSLRTLFVTTEGGQLLTAS